MHFLSQIGVPKLKVKDIVEIQLLPVANRFSVSDEIVILVKFSIQNKYHIYHPDEKKGTPTKIEVASDNGISFIKTLYPQPIVKDYPKIGGTLLLYEKDTYVATVFKALKESRYTLYYTITYGPCTDKVCLQPETKNISVDIEVGNSMANSDPKLLGIYNQLKNTQPSQRSNIITSLKFLLDNNILKYIAFLVLGIISAFTPCILPVIPITLGWFQTLSRKNQLKFVGFISLYILSSASIFGLLGLISNATGGFLGSQLGNFYVIMGISTFFILLTYWTMGAMELPSLNLQSKFSGNWLISILFGGLTGIILSPCIGPILFWVLTQVAHSSSKSSSFFTLFIYAVGLNLPLIVGSFSLSTIKTLTKSPTFANLIKILFSILILGSIIYFAWGYFVKIYLYLVVITIVIGLAIKKYMKWLFGSIPEVINHIGSKIRVSALVIFLVLSLGLVGKIVFTEKDTLFEKGTIEEALPKALQQNKILLVKFFALWCPGCLEEKYTLFNDADVIKALSGYYLLEVDCTTGSDKKYCEKKLAEIGSKGLPTIAFFNKEGKLLNDYLISGPIEKEEFLKIVNNIKNSIK